MLEWWLKMNDDLLALENLALRLVENGEVWPRLVAALTENALDEWLSTGDSEKEQRERLYVKVRVLTELDQLVINLASAGRARRDKK